MALLRTFGWLLVAAALTLPPAAGLLSAPGGSEWRFYGHDLRNTRDAGDQGITPANAARLRLLFRVDTGGDVTGTPVVADGRVFVGTYNGTVRAYDARSGELAWAQPVGAGVSASLAVADGRVYAGDLAGALHAFDEATGAPLWATSLSFGQQLVQLVGSPVPARGSVFVGVASGQETSGSITGFQGALARVDATSGEVVWRTRPICDACNGGAIWSTPGFDLADGLVFAGTGNAYTEPADPHTDSMIAFSFATGDIVWSRQFEHDDVWGATAPTGTDYDFGASPNVFALGGRTVVGEGQKSGQYHVVDARTGASVWDAKLAAGAFVGGFLGSTAMSGGRIFAGVVNAGNGQPQGTSPTDLNAVPTGGKEVAFSALDGGVAWFVPKAPTLGAAAVSGGVVFQGDLAGTLWGFDASDGSVVFAYPAGEPIQSGPSIAGGVVYVGTGGGADGDAAHHLLAFAT